MIQIVNIGGDPSGICKYSLRVNNQELCQFEHNRTDGLTACLLQAASTYLEKQWLEAYKAMQEGYNDGN